MLRARPPGRRALAALAATLVALGAGGGAQAAPVLFDPDGAGGTTTPQMVDEFADATGNALAINAQALINALRTGPGSGTTAPFFTVYQALIEAVKPPDPPGGLAVFNPGSNSNLLTVVAGFWETATIAAGANSVTFSSTGVPQPGSFFEIYSEAPTGGVASDETGQGFRDGTLILKGVHIAGSVAGGFEAGTASAGVVDQHTITGDGAPSPDAVPSVGGGGGTSLNFLITDVATNYFPTLLVGQTLAFFSTTNALPFTRTEPSDAFYTVADTGGPLGAAGRPGTAGTAPDKTPSLGATNGLGAGPDVIFESRASFAIAAAVPEPGSIVLACTGLVTVGLGSLRKLRRRSAVSAA